MGISWILLVVFHVTVLVHAENSCEIQITSDKDFVLLGQSAQVNCSSTCKDLFWETRLSKSGENKTDYFTTVHVEVKDWDDSPIQCITEIDGSTLMKEARVIPYALPSRVEIHMKTELEEDKEHEVTCLMDEVAPLNLVTLSLTKGGSILNSKTFESDTSKGPQSLSHKFYFTASRSDNQQDFACQVTLNLTRVTNTTVQSSPVTVFTYAMPENPQITAEKWIEHGKAEDISCALHNAFPSQYVTTELYVAGFPNTKALGDTMVVLGLNTTELTLGEKNVVCVSQVYGFSKQSNMSIIIYKPPVALLSLSSEVVTVNDTLRISYILVQGNAEYFGLSLSVDGIVEKRVNTPDLTVNYNVTIRKPNLSVICQTSLQENQKVLQQWETIITVHYPPEFPDRSCPERLEWLEGHERLFGCRSDGSPTPEEQCSRNALSLHPATPFTPERNMSGEYTCRASNSIGNVTRHVTVTVEYPPGFPTVEISSSSIGAGGSANLTCYSDALPAPRYSWGMPPHAQVVLSKDNRSITIRDASSYHNGTYTCHVENKHGVSSKQQSLEVQSNKTVIMAVLICVGIVLLLVVVGVFYYCLCQNGKKGFYDLVRRKAGSRKEANIPLHENNSP